MESRRTRYGYVLRLDPGEEVVESLTAFAERESVRGGLISGIGSVGETELGCFAPDRKTYVRRTFSGDHEIGALTGNFSTLDEKPFVHCHAIIAGEDFTAYAGHLLSGIVTVTCEIHIVTEPDAIRRRRAEGAGFFPLAPGADDA